MHEMERYELPDGWRWSTIGQEYQVNERDPKLRELQPELPVSFVPMAAVDAERGVIATPEVKPLGEVRKGFTPFGNNDVIFARITPSMENGKAAIARELQNGVGFGSTEFHVMRPTNGNLPEWVFYFIRQQRFRDEAKANFTGTAGQLRVPDKFIRNAPIPIAPHIEQHRIVKKIEALFAEARTARAALERAEPLLKKFRQAVLSAAFRGELTERDANDEPASALLERIRNERRARWENDLRAKGKDPAESKYVEAASPNTRELAELPEGWEWISTGHVADVVGGIQKMPARTPKKNAYPYLRVANVLRGRLDLTAIHKFELVDGELEKWRLEQNDILVVEGNGSRNEIGRCAIWNNEIKNCVHQNHIIRVRFSYGINPNFFQYYMNSRQGQNTITAVSSSTSGLYTLSVSKLQKFLFPIAPLAEQQRIVERIEALFAQAEQIERGVEIARQRAEKVEQAILARAFRGEL